MFYNVWLIPAWTQIQTKRSKLLFIFIWLLSLIYCNCHLCNVFFSKLLFSQFIICILFILLLYDVDVLMSIHKSLQKSFNMKYVHFTLCPDNHNIQLHRYTLCCILKNHRYFYCQLSNHVIWTKRPMK